LAESADLKHKVAVSAEFQSGRHHSFVQTRAKCGLRARPSAVSLFGFTDCAQAGLNDPPIQCAAELTPKT